MRRINGRAHVGFTFMGIGALIASALIFGVSSAEATPPLNNAIACAPTAIYSTSNSDENRTINLGTSTVNAAISTTAQPIAISITPDGSKAVVASYFGNHVDVIDIATNTIISTSPPIDRPRGSVITRDGRFAYISDGVNDLVKKFDIANNTFVGVTYSVGSEPTGLALTPDGGKLVVANYSSNSISIVDLVSSSIVTVAVGSSPWDVAITPDGTTAITTNQNSNSVTFVQIASGLALATVPVGGSPFGIAITTDGTTAFVTNRLDNDVSTIDIATRTKNPTDIAVGNLPMDVAMTPDGKFAVTANDAGTVSVIDIGTRGVVNTISVTSSGSESIIAVTPCGVVATSLTGRTLTVTGTQWGPANPISLTMASTPTTLGNVVSATNGTFSASYEIPCSVEAGQHTITATSVGGLSASSVVNVPSCSVTPTFAG